ncbi:MAG: 4Fe-4S binding protein [Acutalibacteraceae bacterium]
MNQANFVVDMEKCVGCGKCVKVCPGGILSLNQAKKPEMAEFKNLGGMDVGNASIVLLYVRRVLYLFSDTSRKTVCLLLIMR